MRYYVNTQAQNNGDHEVHKATGCPTPAAAQHQKDLGDHPDCQSAVRAAKKYYAQSNGCANCVPACHTQ
jgi:hypothetical protein